MSLPAFTGTITTILWNGEPSIPAPGGNPPFPTGTMGAITGYNPFNQPIQWNGQVPINIQNSSMNQINQLGFDYQIKIDYVYTIKSGTQAYCTNSTPTLNLVIFQDLSSNNQVFSANLPSKGSRPFACNLGTGTTYCNGSDCPTTTYSFMFTNTTFPDPEFYNIQVNPWNNGGVNYNLGSFTLEVIANISLSVSCQTPEELTSDICLNLCGQPDNQKACFPQYEQFCLKDTGSDGNINLFTNKGCDTFIKQYLSTQGPDATVDNHIDNACKQFTDVDEYNQQTKNVQNICACHLPIDIYNKLRDSLIQEFPGFQYVDENERCLFPPCPSSDYKISVPIGRTCTLPACINIASINNDGTIEGGAQINQSSDCRNAASQTGNNAGQPVEEVKTWIERHWPWVVLGISVLVVLIIIILVVLASEGNKKKKK